MSDSVQELLMLYKNRIIDGEALNNALKALNNAPPQEPQPQEKTLTDKVREKRRIKRKRENKERRQKRRQSLRNKKNVINELK